MALLVLSAYVVPYTVLSHVRAWYGSFLYWVLFAVASIGVVTWLTRRWGEQPPPDARSAGPGAREAEEGRAGRP